MSDGKAETETGAAAGKTKTEAESVGGNSWPIVPLAVASLLLRFLPDRTWAYAVAAVIGGLGAAAALYGVVDSVKVASRRKDQRRPAVGVVLLLVLATTNWIIAMSR
ncbi:hypothetical protein [Streptomyces sp. NPDC089799]|uniref:hypothetical protein n=1 Tax=Streptomyces sp. NPDC089799 TaxID=3155066 RepID=UPI0034153F3C